jgi:hypothetical protein
VTIITVELFDIPRRRAGAGNVTIEISADEVLFSDVLCILGERYPALAATCFEGTKLRAGYLASVGGKRFIRDPDARLCGGDALLIMSADAGG